MSKLLHPTKATEQREITDKKINLKAWVQTDRGRVRKSNEDSSLVDTTNRIFAVADGMGGHQAGAVASRTAIEALKNYLHNALPSLKRLSVHSNLEQLKWVEEIVKNAFLTANFEVYRKSVEKGLQGNMGTTLSLLLFINNRQAIIGHVGDSRIYKIREKEVIQLTQDQTLIQEQIRKGMLKPEDASKVPFGNTLLQAIGYRPSVSPQIEWTDIQIGDRFLLCSDGLSNYIEEDELLAIFTTSEGDDIVPRLISCANNRGGKDNITAVVVEVEDPDDSFSATQLDLSNSLVKNYQLFSQLSMDEVFHVLRFGQLKIFIADEVIFSEDSEPSGLYIIMSGKVGIFQKGTLLTTLGPGEHFGENSILSSRTNSETAISEEESKLIFFPKETFGKFLDENPKLGKKIFFNLAKNLEEKMRHYGGRLAQLLRQIGS